MYQWRWCYLPSRQRKWRLLVWPVCQRFPHDLPGPLDVVGSIHSTRKNGPDTWKMCFSNSIFKGLLKMTIFFKVDLKKAFSLRCNSVPCFPDSRWPVWRWAGPQYQAAPLVKPGAGAWCLGGTRHWVSPRSAADNWPLPSGSAWQLCEGECSHSVARNKDIKPLFILTLFISNFRLKLECCHVLQGISHTLLFWHVCQWHAVCSR